MLSHDLALPGALARALSARTGRGTDVDVVASPMTTASSAPGKLAGLKPRHYAAIVVILGAHEAVGLTSLRAWRRQLARVLQVFQQSSPGTAHVFILGVQPIRSVPIFDSLLGSVADRHARAMNRATARMCAELPNVTFVPMTAPSSPPLGRFRTAEDYRRWADLLADEIAPPLDAGHLDIDDSKNTRSTNDTGTDRVTTAPDHPPLDAERLEQDRQRAVDGLRILDTGPEDRFDRVIALAQRSFGTQLAVFVVVDGKRLWVKASVGPAPKELPRSNSFTSLALREPGTTVVPDALADENFCENSFVLGEPYVRFFAGFPIESPSGERIGALCLFDPEPRTADEIDTVLLRELALVVQSELQSALQTAPTARPRRDSET